MGPDGVQNNIQRTLAELSKRKRSCTKKKGTKKNAYVHTLGHESYSENSASISISTRVS